MTIGVSLTTAARSRKCDRVDPLPAADADAPEVLRLVEADDAVDVLAVDRGLGEPRVRQRRRVCAHGLRFGHHELPNRRQRNRLPSVRRENFRSSYPQGREPGSRAIKSASATHLEAKEFARTATCLATILAASQVGAPCESPRQSSRTHAPCPTTIRCRGPHAARGVRIHHRSERSVRTRGPAAKATQDAHSVRSRVQLEREHLDRI